MKNTFLLLLFLCFSCASNVLAWDDTGHKITTYIAWQQMSAAARENAIKVLMSAPEDSDLSVFYPAGSRSKEAKQLELFMIASTWSDIVRDRNFKVRNEKYHHGTWHYLDTFWRDANGRPEIVSELKPDDENAVERLFFFDKLLRDSSKGNDEKAIALAWILHVGGDIHQPLHCSGRVTDVEPKGDQGGNLFDLTPKDTPREKRENLHYYWDSIITKSVPRQNDACDYDYIPSVANKIMKKFPAAKMTERLKLGKFDEWQQEGYQLAIKEVYANGLKRFETPSASYQKRALQISNEQLALAGYRLGAMLNQIYGQ